MNLQIIIPKLGEKDRDVGAVVPDPLVVRRDVLEDNAKLHGALALADPSGMAPSHLKTQAVDDALQGLCPGSRRDVHVLVAPDGERHDVIHCPAVDGKFLPRSA